MKRDIDKLADRLVKLGREGIAVEAKISDLEIAQKNGQSDLKPKAT
jgi:hypothetical protein